MLSQCGTFQETEIMSLIEMGRSDGFEIRFIEFMPLDSDKVWERDKVFIRPRNRGHDQRELRTCSHR